GWLLSVIAASGLVLWWQACPAGRHDRDGDGADADDAETEPGTGDGVPRRSARLLITALAVGGATLLPREGAHAAFSARTTSARQRLPGGDLGDPVPRPDRELRDHRRDADQQRGRPR